jgi:hypothetical protein
MAHQGFDLQLTRYDEKGGRATFYTTGMERSPTSATTLMMRDELPEEHAPEFKRLGRLSHGAHSSSA